MARKHWLLALFSIVLTTFLGLPAAVAAPAAPPGAVTKGEDPANGPDRNEIAAGDPAAAVATLAAGENQAGAREGYPRQTRLRVFPEDPSDKSIKLGLVPYHAIAPRLNALQARSDRVSVEIAGRSTLGRDLYLVTLTAPERPWQTRLQDHWRELIENDPVRAARDPLLEREYKVPVWINNNIHGNEWEGTDAALRLIEHLATSNDPKVRRLLAEHRIYFNVTANPDGRVAGTRGNNNGFDLNRDFVTSSQPENVAMREIVERIQPVMMLDEHGYVEGTLIEPTGPPHGQNYDFDLYIRHGLANGLGMEAAVKALGFPEAQNVIIPFRDIPPGEWDGWAPIYTAQYSMFHGAVSYTIEIPLQVNNNAYNTLPVDELRRRAAINTAVSESSMRTTLDYVDLHDGELVDNQIEIFRRGTFGEPQRFIPDGFVPGFGPEDRFTTQFPRAYVIPVGPAQRSAAAAARLVDHLVAHDVRVRQAVRDFRLNGRDYPAGSYLVDLHQPKRALANVMLENGRDVSNDAPVMFDISGWSHRLLWGASVDILASGQLHVPSRPVAAASPTGGVDPAPGRDLAITVRDGKDARAVNDLLGRGLELRRRADATVLVPASARADAIEVANRYGVRFTVAPLGDPGTVLRRPTVAAAVAADELFALRDMGFDVRPVSTATLNAGFDLSRIDTLVVSSGLRVDQLNPAARAALDAYLARGGGVITRGATGSRFNADAGLLQLRAVPGKSDANGTVTVTNAPGVLGGDGLPHSFVFAPQWFTDLGPGVTVEQRYGPGNPLTAGHWLPNDDGTGGRDAAAGQPLVVSGTDERGARVLMFGSEPLFRAHPKGLFAQVANAVYWTGSASCCDSARDAIAPAGPDR
ncbi:MAG TPA: M14 family zinc carboxypeptidase [Actinophytocola sp.]|uniref:M14 family zinc carboxypeptidase n=1 Tax=Actinophytocola sp. TaxID=1872138 RepID=UPI002DDCAE40|nr:M14 family zinc carboxypeptidase [Actinophytocola sp.]HEV2780749.1 M14 family zinc carboxypeptidase [Actinophytocola sp.]